MPEREPAEQKRRVGALLAREGQLFGPPEMICDELERRRSEYGISYFTVTDEAFEAFAPVVAKLAGT